MFCAKTELTQIGHHLLLFVSRHCEIFDARVSMSIAGQCYSHNLMIHMESNPIIVHVLNPSACTDCQSIIYYQDFKVIH